MPSETLPNGIKRQDVRDPTDGPAQRAYDNAGIMNSGIALAENNLNHLKPPDGAVMLSRKASGNVSIFCQTTSGQYAVDWWDGTRTLHNSGGAAATKAAANNGMKLVRVYPATAGESLTYFSCNGNSLTSLDVSGLTSLTVLACYDNSLTSLDVSGLTSVTTLACSNNNLTSLDVSGLTSMTTLTCDDNNLTSLLANGLNLTYNYYGTGSDIKNNSLSEAALIAFVESLAVTTTGVIEYGGNPGSTAFETWLATGDDKNYVWSNT